MMPSVIMATYNNEREIGLAVASVLLQNCEDFELVVVNDGSTDATPQILERFAARDDRVVLLHNRRNLGRARARNRAIQAARGELLAVLDADDIAMPQRLDRQVTYMQAHEDVGMLGSWTIRIDGRHRPLDVIRGPTQDADLRRQFRRLRMPFSHSTAMFRREALLASGLYDARFVRSQDGHLCRRVIQKTGAAVLPEFLVLYRLDDSPPPAGMRARYRWSAYAGWDNFKRSPNLAGLIGLGRLLLQSCLPASALTAVSGLHQRNRPPSEAQRAQIREWVERLQGFAQNQSDVAAGRMSVTDLAGVR